MKKLLFLFYTAVAFLFSLTVSTNLFAFLLHRADILGRPQLGRIYEPFHILYWFFTIRVPGSQYRVSFIAFLVCFALLAFLGFRVYTRLRVNVLGIYGQSRWLKERELKQTGSLDGEGVIIGQTTSARFHKNRKGEYRMLAPGKVIFDDSSEHLLIVAPTGSGKGISCVIPTLFSWKHSAIVYDIKRENFEITSGWRRKFSYVFRFEPTNPDSIHFNPLWEIDKGPREVSQAQNIASIICNPYGDAVAEDHWSRTAQQLLVGAILYVLYCDDEHDKSLHGVYHLLNDPNRTKSEVFNSMLSLDHPVVQESARNMLNKPPNELGSVLSTASAFLAIFQDPIVSANTAYSDFNIKDLTNSDHPCTLYICVNPESAQRLTPLIRLLFDFIGKKLTSDLHINKHRILFLIDEFPSLGRLSFFEKQLAFFRGYKIKCMLIAQSFNQLFSQYGERNSIIDNCKIKAILGVGSAQDAKLVSDTLGSYSVNRETISQSGTLGNVIARTRSTSYMETKRELMTVDEILRLPFENFILIKDGQFPYQGRKIMYYTDRRFLPRVKLQTISTSHEQQREIPSRQLQLYWIDDANLKKLKMAFAGPPERALAQLHQTKLLTAQTTEHRPNAASAPEPPEDPPINVNATEITPVKPTRQFLRPQDMRGRLDPSQNN